MKIKELFSTEISENYKNDFKNEMILINIKRGILFSSIIIVFELIFLFIGIISNYWPYLCQWAIEVDFSFGIYYKMYLLMLVVAALYWLLFHYLKDNFGQGHIDIRKVEIFMIIVITFLMVWGAVISLYDQRLYGNIIVYVVNVMLGSMIFYLEQKHLIIPYLLSLAVLAIGLPYFQESRDILFGHYVNISIFLVLIWVMTRTRYSNFVKNYINRRLIEEKNTELEKEIARREEVQKQLEKVNEKLLDLSFEDKLTGIPNRRKLDDILDYEWKRSVRDQTAISLIMIDIDFFKEFNDHYGHLSGDNCLISVARAMYSCRRRSTDFVARFGGEEFIFLALSLNEEGTAILAEKLRQSVEALRIPHEYSPVAQYLTISLGTTTIIPTENDSLFQSIANADRALYQAKLDGRNLVRSYPV